MARLPHGWVRTVCPDCGRECVAAVVESGLRMRMDPEPRRLYVYGCGGRAVQRECYTPHLATCDYRGPR